MLHQIGRSATPAMMPPTNWEAGPDLGVREPAICPQLTRNLPQLPKPRQQLTECQLKNDARLTRRHVSAIFNSIDGAVIFWSQGPLKLALGVTEPSRVSFRCGAIYGSDAGVHFPDRRHAGAVCQPPEATAGHRDTNRQSREPGRVKGRMGAARNFSGDAQSSAAGACCTAATACRYFVVPLFCHGSRERRGSRTHRAPGHFLVTSYFVARN